MKNKIRCTYLLGKHRYSILSETGTKQLSIRVDKSRGLIAASMSDVEHRHSPVPVKIGDTKYYTQFKAEYDALIEYILHDFKKYKVTTLEELAGKLYNERIVRDIQYIEKNLPYEIKNNKILYKGTLLCDGKTIEGELHEVNENTHKQINDEAYKVHATMILGGLSVE